MSATRSRQLQYSMTNISGTVVLCHGTRLRVHRDAASGALQFAVHHRCSDHAQEIGACFTEMSMQVDSIDTLDAFVALEANWNQLYLNGPETKYFMSWRCIYQYLNGLRENGVSLQ